MINGNTKTVTEVVEELKDEIIEFVSTRFAMLEAEFDEKVQWLKMSVPVLGLGFILLGTAWFLLTGFLVCMIAQAFAPSSWSWAISFLITGVLYATLGGAAAYLAWHQLKDKGVKPERTLRTLKQDTTWLREVKTQL